MIKRLLDLCDIQYGYAFDSSMFCNDKQYPQLARIRDVKRGYSETFYSGEYSDEYVLKKNDLLIGMDGDFNIARWNIDGALLNQRVCKIKAKKDINEEYIRYALTKKLKQIENRTAFVTVKHLSAKELSKIEIDLPVLNEQNTIVNQLNTLEKVITIKREQISELDNIVKSRFVEMFGDSVSGFKYDKECFENYVNVMLKGPFGSDVKKSLYVPKGEDTYKVYIQVNVIQKNETLGDYYISKEYYDKKMHKFSVNSGDYLITCDGTLGKLFQLPNTFEQGIISASLLKISLNEKINNKYFEYLWELVMMEELKRSVRNSALNHLPSAKVIGKQEIPIPPIEIQNEFALFVQQIDKSKFVIQKSLEETQKLFDSLMQEYFG